MVRVILLAILVLLVARAFWRLVDGIIGGASGREARSAGRAQAVKLVRDPVCGTFIAPTGSLSVTRGGATHYFCSERCRTEFTKRTA